MAKNQSLAQFFASKGMRLRTWARAKKLNSKDILLIYQISYGWTKGVRGRAKELKGLLEKEGFGRALAHSIQNAENGARRTDLSGGAVDFASCDALATHSQSETHRLRSHDFAGAKSRNDDKSGIVPCGNDKKGA